MVLVGLEVLSVNGLCPAFNACPNSNIFQTYFGIEFNYEGHSYIRTISSYEFVRCFNFIDQLTYRLSQPPHKFCVDRCDSQNGEPWWVIRWGGSRFSRGTIPNQESQFSYGVKHRRKFHKLGWAGVRTQDYVNKIFSSNPLYHTPPLLCQTHMEYSTTLICCGCAYVWVLLTLLLVSPNTPFGSCLEFWIPSEGLSTAV